MALAEGEGREGGVDMRKEKALWWHKKETALLLPSLIFELHLDEWYKLNNKNWHCAREQLWAEREGLA